MRMAGALLVAAVVAFLGGKILAEYPFDSLLPVLGALLLGLSVTGAGAAVLRATPPWWATVATAVMAVLAERMAVLVDRGPHGTVSWEGYASIVAAGIGGLWRLRHDLARRPGASPPAP